MKVKEWMVTAGITILMALLAVSVEWGSQKTTIDNYNTRITNLETFKDQATSTLGEMDGKLDMLLQANGLSYQPKRKNNSD